MAKYGNSIIEIKHIWEKGEKYMLNDEICKLRDKLNDSIIKGESYEKILKLSTDLDKLIEQHYLQKQTVDD